MSIKVIYYTRTGKSKLVAERIARAFSVDPIEIKDDENWTGKSGYVKGLIDARRHKDVDITLSKSVDLDDEFIIVSPNWAEVPVPAVEKFIMDTLQGKPVHLVILSSYTDEQKTIQYYDAHDYKFKSVFPIIGDQNFQEEMVRVIVSKVNNHLND